MMKSVLMAVKNLANMSSRDVYDFSYEKKAVVWLPVVYLLLFDKNQRYFLLNKSREEILLVASCYRNHSFSKLREGVKIKQKLIVFFPT